MMLYGKVLWWSEQDENGIIVDPKGTEFYFDISVLKIKNISQIKRNSLVTFQINRRIRDCLCAESVEAAPRAKKQALQKLFETTSQMTEQG